MQPKIALILHETSAKHTETHLSSATGNDVHESITRKDFNTQQRVSRRFVPTIFFHTVVVVAQFKEHTRGNNTSFDGGV